MSEPLRAEQRRAADADREAVVDRLQDAPSPPNAPVVRVRGFALMGGIDATRRPPPKSANPGETPPALER